jgi:restriction system protein
MLPVVRMCEANGSESIPNSTFMERLAEQFQLTDQDREELLSSGKQSRFENRVYWALVHLRRAGLLESTGRGLNRITERGREILRQRPAKIDLKLLNQFPELRAFRTSKPSETQEAVQNPEPVAAPQERIDTAFAELRETLVSELREKLAT